MKARVNPKSTSNQSSKPCTVLQYPSTEDAKEIHTDSSEDTEEETLQAIAAVARPASPIHVVHDSSVWVAR